MLDIIVSGESLDLGDATVSFTFVNPLFDKNAFQKEYSFGFTIPLTPKNRRIFTNSSRIDTAIRNQEASCEVRIKGLFFFRGVMAVKTQGNKAIACHLNGESLDLMKKLQALSLQDLELREYIVNPAGLNPNSKQDNWQDHLVDILALPIEEQDHVFPEIQPSEHPYFNDDFANAIFSGVFNRYDDGAGEYYHPDKDPQFEWEESIIPLVKWKYVFEQMMLQSGLSAIEGLDFYNDERTERLVCFSMKTMDALEKQGANWYNVYQDTYKLQDYLPVMNAFAAVDAFRSTFNLFFTVVDGALRVRSKAEIITTPEEDLTDFFSPDYSFEWYNDGGGFTGCYAEDAQDPEDVSSVFSAAIPFSCSDIERIIVDYENGVPPQFFAFGQNFETGSNKFVIPQRPPTNHPGTWFVETKRKALSVEETGSGDNVNMMRFLNYLGFNFVTDTIVATGTNYVQDGGGNIAYQNLWSLSINDLDGVWANFWVPFLDLINTAKSTTKNGTLTPAQIKRLIDWDKPIKRIYHKEGYSKCFVETVKFSASASKLSPVSVDFVAV